MTKLDLPAGLLSVVAGVVLLAGCSSSSSGKTAAPDSATQAAPSSDSPSASGTASQSDTASSPPAPPSSSPPSSAAPSPPSSAPPSSPAPPSSTGSSTGRIDDTYYPIKLANSWTYRVNLGPKLGMVIDVETVTRVVPASDGVQFTMSRKFHYLSGQAKDFVSVETFQLHKDGSLSVPLQQNMSASNTKVTVKSGDLRYPTPKELSAGTTKKGVLQLVVTAQGRTVPVTASLSVHGAGTADVKVPARGYKSARILDQTIVERVSGVSIIVKTRTYFARGVGPIKALVTSAAGAGQTLTSELIAFHKG